MSRCFLVLALISFARAQDPKVEVVVPRPTAENLAAWRAHIMPPADQLRFLAIPWHQTFGEGMLAAKSQGKPLLFWAMNGHPLGCT